MIEGDLMLLWNMLLTALLAFVGFIAKFMWSEIQRLQILLNKTREEICTGNLTERRKPDPRVDEILRILKTKADFEVNT